jgi:hypothetical protein
MVTFCSVWAWGSILSTDPSNGRLANASTVTVARWPTWIFPTSVSSTRVRTCTRPRSAIRRSTVPPPTSRVGEEITWPRSTSFSMMVPLMGARTLVSSIWFCASSTATLARTTSARALA